MRMKLSVKISLLVVAAALAAGVAVALVDYGRASKEMLRAAEDKLLAVLQARTTAINDYLLSVQRDLRLQATNPFAIEALSRLMAARLELGANADETLRAFYAGEDTDPDNPQDSPTEPSAYAAWHDRFHPTLSNSVDRNGYRDLLLLDLDGHVVYSVRKRDDFATDVMRGAPKNGDSAAPTTWQRPTGPRANRSLLISRLTHRMAASQPVLSPWRSTTKPSDRLECWFSKWQPSGSIR